MQRGVVFQRVALFRAGVGQKRGVVCSGDAAMIIIEGRITAHAAPAHTAVVGAAEAGVLARARRVLRKLEVAEIANLIDVLQNGREVLVGGEMHGVGDLDVLAEQVPHARELIEDAGYVQGSQAQRVPLGEVDARQRAKRLHFADVRLPRIACEKAHVKRVVADNVAEGNVVAPHARVLVVQQREEVEVPAPGGDVKRGGVLQVHVVRRLDNPLFLRNYAREANSATTTFIVKIGDVILDVTNLRFHDILRHPRKERSPEIDQLEADVLPFLEFGEYTML